MGSRQFPEIPATVSTRDARYISPYLEIVTEQLEATYKSGDKFSIIDSTERLKCLSPLKQTTRVDVAGAIIRTLLAMNILTRSGKSFMFPSGSGKQVKPKLKPKLNGSANHVEKPKRKKITSRFAPPVRTDRLRSR